jgi:hypothetical protein
MAETSIEKTAHNKAERAGFFARKVRWEGRVSAPDHVFSREDRGAVWIEFKKPGEEPTEAQNREHKRMRAAGMEVHWADSAPQALAILGVREDASWKRYLVCGGRDFCDWRKLDTALRRAFGNSAGVVIQGEAIGADFLAKAWALANGIEVESYPADWKTHGKAAGGIRNQQMLDEAKPDAVIAFPGGSGTADMKRRARKAGVKVYEVE